MTVRVEVNGYGEDTYVSCIDVDGESVSIFDIAKTVEKFFEELRNKEVSA